MIVELNWNASTDNVAVDGYQLLLNGTVIDVGNVLSYTTSVENTFTVRAYVRAYDTSGNRSAWSNEIISDNTPPTVYMDPIEVKAEYDGTVYFTAHPEDDVAVLGVAFFVDNIQVAFKTTAPYVFAWDTRSVPNGDHFVAAIAFDTSGNISDPAFSGNMAVNNPKWLTDIVTSRFGVYGLTKLEPSYEGPALRVEFIGSAFQYDVPFDEFGEINAEDLNISGETFKLVKWYDQSGNGNDITAVSGQEPAFILGNLSLSFDGSSIALPNMSSYTELEALVKFKVAEQPATSGFGGFWRTGTSSDDSYLPSYFDGRVYDDFGSTTRKIATNALAPLTNYSIYSVYSKPSEWKNFINGTLLHSTVSNTVAGPVNGKLGESLNVGNYLVGNISHLILFDEVMSDTDRGLIWSRAMTTGGIPDVPENVSTTPYSDRIELTWEQSSDELISVASGYEIRVNFAVLIDVGDVLSYTLNSLPPNSGVSFNVRSYDAEGNYSGWSPTVNETTLP